jgi:hypothetical protein
MDQPGKGPGLASLAPQVEQGENNPGPIDWFKSEVNKFWNWLTGKSQPPTPTLDINAVATQVAKTLTQLTQTAQAQIKPIVTSIPTPFITPTPTAIPMVVLADGLNLRWQPTTAANPPLVTIPKGRLVYANPNSMPMPGDSCTWIRVTYADPTVNAKAIAASPEFLDPLDDYKIMALP